LRLPIASTLRDFFARSGARAGQHAASRRLHDETPAGVDPSHGVKQRTDAPWRPGASERATAPALARLAPSGVPRRGIASSPSSTAPSFSSAFDVTAERGVPIAMAR